MKIVLTGQGTALALCAKQLQNAGEHFTIIEQADHGPTASAKKLERIGAPFYSLPSAMIYDKLCEMADDDDDLFVFSIVFLALFPRYLVERPNITIINYHNAILPDHRGMNCEAWQIFEMDRYAGVTWHYVDSGIDTGHIICEAKIPIGEDMTSIELLQQQAKLSSHLFEQIYPRLIRGEAIPTRYADRNKRSTLHRSDHRPNGGTLDAAWSSRQAWAFLRAMDYGLFETMGRPTVVYDGTPHTWDMYSRFGDLCEDDAPTIHKEGQDLILSYPKCVIALSNITHI